MRAAVTARSNGRYPSTMDFIRREIYCTSENVRTVGFIERRDLSISERATRGLKTGGLLWLAAVFSVFVPILHFVLVPGFLLAGLIFGYASWHTRAELSHGEFVCPNCKRTNTLPRMGESFPYVTRCEGCSFTLTLTKE